MNSRFHNEDRRTTSLSTFHDAGRRGRAWRPSVRPKAFLKPASAQAAAEVTCNALKHRAYKVRQGVWTGEAGDHCPEEWARKSPSEALWIKGTYTKCMCYPDTRQWKQSQERGRGWGGGAGQPREVVEAAQNHPGVLRRGLREASGRYCTFSPRPHATNRGSNSHLYLWMRKR